MTKSLNIRYLLSIIADALHNNQRIITIPVFLNSSLILHILYKLGIIQSFENRGLYNIIYLKLNYILSWDNQKNYIELSSKQLVKKKHSIKLHQLNKLANNSNFICLMTTDRGFNTTNNIIKIKVGGVPLLKII